MNYGDDMKTPRNKAMDLGISLMQSILSIAVIMAIAFLLSLVSDSPIYRGMSTGALIGWAIVTMITSDALWWARKPFWKHGKIWVNPFGRNKDRAPPFFWQQDRSDVEN